MFDQCTSRSLQPRPSCCTYFTLVEEDLFIVSAALQPSLLSAFARSETTSEESAMP